MAIGQDNDRFRQGLGEGAPSLSADIVGLGAANPARIIAAVAAFDDFDDGDLSDIHALGDFESACPPSPGEWHELSAFGSSEPQTARALQTKC